MFVDSDDILPSHSVSTLVNIYEKEHSDFISGTFIYKRNDYNSKKNKKLSTIITNFKL